MLQNHAIKIGSLAIKNQSVHCLQRVAHSLKETQYILKSYSMLFQ